MNKQLLTVATALLAVGLLAGPALAQDSEKNEKAKTGQKRQMRQQRNEGGEKGERGERMKKYAQARYRMMKSRLIRELELSETKADEVREVFKAHAAARKEANKEKREEMKKLRQEIKEARDADDQATADEKMAEIKEIFVTQREQGRKELIERLSGVLDKDQLAKAKLILKPRKGHRLGRIAAAMKTMDLNEDQIKKIDGIMEDASKKILETLTPAQKEQLEKKLKSKGLPGAKKLHKNRGDKDGRYKGKRDRGGDKGDEGDEGDKDDEHPRRRRDRKGERSGEDKE